MAAQRTIEIKEGLLPFRVVIPERLSSQRDAALRATCTVWMDWLRTDEAEGLWQSGWDEKDQFFTISFSHLETATAFKIRFC